MTRVAGTNRTQPPAPSPEMVTAARQHLTERYACGVDRLLWEAEKRPMPDAAAIQAAVCAAAAGDRLDALTVGAALVLTQAMRLDLDVLEADVLDAAKASGVPAESLAAVLGLPDAGRVRARHRALAARRELPRAAVEPAAVPPRPGEAAERADRASLRASHAAERAAQARRRQEELARARARVASGARATPGISPALAELAAANAGTARLNARDAAERVALGLLRAADALEQCANRYEQRDSETTAADGTHDLRKRAEEYARAARTYREMAGRYRDIGRHLP